MKLKTQFAFIVILCIFAHLPVQAQVRPVNDYGALGLGHLLNRLNTTASVMMIGAHPDDEDSALLAYLARGENARTAYLSLTRGDGGQNIIGPELGEALGIIRTEELLQARRLDGAEQYFTRAYDYGFSKTLAEAKSKWPEDVIKCDVVHAIRLFRPMVVISRFTGTPADGHGHHQYAGYITPIAVQAAADPQQCTADGEPWQVLKFYVEQSFSDASQPTLRINTGQYDLLLGRTYFEVAMEGRSQHRSQGEGRLELHGDQFSGLNLIDSKTMPSEKDKSIFDGLNTSIGAVDDVLGVSERPSYADVAQAAELAASIRREFRSAALGPTAASLAKLLDALRLAAEAQNRAALSRSLLRTKIDECVGALRIATGFQLDALADSETLVPGGGLSVTSKAYLPKDSTAKIDASGLLTPPRWTTSQGAAPKDNTTGFVRRETATLSNFYTVNVPRDERLTQPYWLVSPREGDLFNWRQSADWPGEKVTLPFEQGNLKAFVTVEIGSTRVDFQESVRFRFADPARGEIRREVNVVPALSVGVDRDSLIVPQSARPQVIRLVVSVTNNTSKEQSGNVSLNIAASPEWNVAKPLGSTFSVKTQGAKASIPFDITVPAKAKVGPVSIRASAEVGMARYALTMNVVAYPHIQKHRFYTAPDAVVEVLDLKTAPAKVGYIMGSGDEVPEAIRQMGMDVTMLEEKDLAAGDLSRFDTIVVGIRASETRPDLVANNARLLDYVKNGGTVVMQYQRFSWTGLAPYPVDIQDKQGTTAGSIARVVDENAPVKILDPQHPVFNFPNKITDADFNGWVQERNAYNLVTFDPEYTPLLESHDAGEQENKGGLVIAKVGKGNWVYCSYSFFRQLPAGVPGAYRLFANLLSIPKAK